MFVFVDTAHFVTLLLGQPSLLGMVIPTAATAALDADIVEFVAPIHDVPPHAAVLEFGPPLLLATLLSPSFLRRFAGLSAGLDEGGGGGGDSVTPGRQMGAGDAPPCELLRAGDDGGEEAAAAGATGEGRVLNRALHGSRPCADEGH